MKVITPETKTGRGEGGIAIVDASPSQLPKKKLHTDSQQYPLNLCLRNNEVCLKNVKIC